MRILILLSLSLTFLFACSRSVSNKPEQQVKSDASPQLKVQSQQSKEDALLGLPPVPVPAENPQTTDKIALGDKLFHDKRFSIDGTVSCANCHDRNLKPLPMDLQFSKGHSGLTGSRSAPTVVNAVFYKSQFWDGREPDLEGQSKQPFINPVEGGLPDHEVYSQNNQNRPRLPSVFFIGICMLADNN